jgi:hypothetical protein
MALAVNGTASDSNPVPRLGHFCRALVGQFSKAPKAWRIVVGKRLKQSGMFWTVRGANAILALRCYRLNREFEDYWASRNLAA